MKLYDVPLSKALKRTLEEFWIECIIIVLVIIRMCDA